MLTALINFSPMHFLLHHLRYASCTTQPHKTAACSCSKHPESYLLLLYRDIVASILPHIAWDAQSVQILPFYSFAAMQRRQPTRKVTETTPALQPMWYEAVGEVARRQS